MSKICSNCNATLKENQKFCTQCGTKYEERTYKKNHKSNYNKEKELTDEEAGFIIAKVSLILGLLIFSWLIFYSFFNTNILIYFQFWIFLVWCGWEIYSNETVQDLKTMTIKILISFIVVGSFFIILYLTANYGFWNYFWSILGMATLFVLFKFTKGMLL